jgi:hypothetical protein
MRVRTAARQSASAARSIAATAMTHAAAAAPASATAVKIATAHVVCGHAKLAVPVFAPTASKLTKGVPIAMNKNKMSELKTDLRRPATLRFSPTAWAKLLFLRDAGETEIGGFGIARADDLLFVEDLRLVRQSCTWASADFDDSSVADYFDEQVDAGRPPQQFFRVFIHTHPGSSPRPSLTDEATFGRVFGRTDWAVMFILARSGACYARLRFNVGPGAEMELPVEVDYGRPFAASDSSLWQEEYLANVCVRPPDPPKTNKSYGQSATPLTYDKSPSVSDDGFADNGWRDAWSDYTEFDRYPEEEPYAFIRDY